LLIGNKKDKVDVDVNEREVTEEQVNKLIEEYRQKGWTLKYLETSATDFTDNDIIINSLVDIIFE
jgi:translation initiation factor 2 alpha subunit (eIF-2alpha)